MSATHTDLVIQISTAKLADAPNPEIANDGLLVAELRRTLRPGVEIVLVFRGYMATMSILWLDVPFANRSLRAGVRLLGVSVLPAGYVESSTPIGRSTAPDAAPLRGLNVFLQLTS